MTRLMSFCGQADRRREQGRDRADHGDDLLVATGAYSNIGDSRQTM